MKELLNTLEMPDHLKEIISWGTTYFSSYKALIESAVTVSVVIVAYILTKMFSTKIDSFFTETRSKRMISRKTVVFFHDHILGIVNSLLFSLSLIPFKILKTQAHILTSITILVFSWVIANVLTSLIKNSLLSRFVAIVIWSIATLNLLGLYGKTIKILDSVFVTLGDIKISPYLIIKGAVTIVFFMWLAKVIADLSDKNISRSKSLSPSLRVLSIKMIRVFVYTFAILLGLSGIGVNLTAFTVFSGAVGVGVGFGLQKIVANIVSGFIVLMDESIKPGDIIQLDDKFGTIQTMGARYISVVAWDGMEHLIPNEDIITNKVINWTHSNKRILISLDIGVSYRSDVHLVKKLILEAANQFTRVLKEPTTQCNLKGFGDSSVDFRLYFWIEDPEEGTMSIKSDILFKVWDLFKEHNIEIPFPQRDLHFKSISETQFKDILNES